MNHTIQIKVEPEQAEKFIAGLELSGYTAVRVVSKGQTICTNVHFTKDGETSIKYSATISLGDEPYAFIGVRPE
jgi:hypothetical protein